MTDKAVSLEDLAADINKRFGAQVLLKGSEARQTVPRISSGVLAFDHALGGGWAANQWNEIVGSESDGKTAIAYKTIAHNQALDPNWLALIVAAEEYVPSYARAIGVDTDRLWVIETNEMEPALNTVLKAIENRLVDCVVIDSLPALVTSTEVGKDMDENSIATGAKVLSTFFKKSVKAQRRSLVDGVEDRQCTMIALNQWRDQIGVMFGDPRTTPLGKAKNYYYFTRMEVRRDEWLKTGSTNETRIGQTIKARVFKNKTYRPHQVAQVDFYFADAPPFHKGEFDITKDIVNVCLALEVFEGRYSFDGVRLANKKEDLYAVVRADPDLQRRLWVASQQARPALMEVEQ